MSTLKVQQLSQLFGKRSALHSICFEVPAGQLVAFLGPNGAGKTTLFRTLMGFLPLPHSVKSQAEWGIFLDGKCINEWSVSKRVAEGLLYLPQQSSLFVQLTVFENLKLVFQHHPFWRTSALQQKTTIKKAMPGGCWPRFEEELYRLLQKMHLTNVLAKRIAELSGGQKRKVEVVRSLLMHPNILMLDEPFAGVDPKSIYELKEIFVDLTCKGLTILIADHHVDQLFSIASTIHVVIDGTIVTSGTIENIMRHQYTKDMYFGGKFYAEMTKRYVRKKETS